MKYNNLIRQVNQDITTNGNRQITGAKLNSILNEMISVLGDGFRISGEIYPDSLAPTDHDRGLCYIAAISGTYVNFDNITVNDSQIGLIYYNERKSGGAGWDFYGWNTNFAPINKSVPSGGTTGQVLSKSSDADNDVEWAEVGGGVTVIEEHEQDPSDITDLRKLYRRNGDIPSNLLQPSYIYVEGVEATTEAQVNTNNIQVTKNNISDFFDDAFSQVINNVSSINEYVFSFRVIENDIPISAIRLGTSNVDNTGSITFIPTGSDTTLYIGKYFYIDYQTGDRVYNTDAVVVVNGTTYTFDNDDDILEIEVSSGEINIQSTSEGRVVLYSIDTIGEPYGEWDLEPLDSIRERGNAINGLRKTLMDDHITPTETTVATHSTDIQNLKVGVRDIGTEITNINGRIGNIKIDSINRLPRASYEYINQIYRVNDKYYECYVSVAGNAQYFEWIFDVNGTSEITSSNWDSFAAEVGNGFSDNTALGELSKCFRNNGSIKLGSSSTPGRIDFDISLEDITTIEIDYAGYNSNKSSTITIDFFDNQPVVIDTTDTQRHTYIFENLSLNNPEVYISSEPSGAGFDNRAIIYGIRVHAGTPSTYAWRETGGGNIFWVEVDVTTFAEIKNAIDAGKTVMLKDEENYVYTISYVGDYTISFSYSSGEENTIKTYNVFSDDSYEFLYISDIETRQHIVQSISSTSSGEEYPSASAVYHAIHPTVGTSMPVGGFLPNVVYNLSSTVTGSVTWTMATANDNSIANIWCWSFNTGSTAPTITWPAGILEWNGGEAPAIDSDKHYEISVMNGIACFMETEIPQ